MSSDIDDSFTCDDEEYYGLDYSEESNSDPDVDLENQYYNSKNLKTDDLKLALESFRKVVALEGGSKGDWGFKALKQMIKINFKLNHFDEMMQNYKHLLCYIKSAVTKNHGEKSINSILDYMSNTNDIAILEKFYESTLEALKDGNNDRLWFKITLKLGKLYLDRCDFTRLGRVIKQLKKSCKTISEEEDLKKGTQRLEICALEIQMYTAQKNYKKLKALYEKSLQVKSAIPHPMITGVIRECGGKMHLREGEFEKAHADFFEAFRSYEESGSPRRAACLKYLSLASMLTESSVDPFESQEAKPYRSDPEILAMSRLVASYRDSDAKEFESILKANQEEIANDPFVKEHVEVLLKNVRTKVLRRLVKPYTRITIQSIADELDIDEPEAESLLVSCILDNTIRGKIDQVNQVLILQEDASDNRYTSLDNWVNQLTLLQESVFNKLYRSCEQ